MVREARQRVEAIIMLQSTTAVASGAALPVTLDTQIAGEDQTNNVMVTEQGQFTHYFVSASSSFTLGATGAVGDFLHAYLLTANTGATTIMDGTTTVAILPASFTLGSHELNIVSRIGALSVITAGSTNGTAIGRFT